MATWRTDLHANAGRTGLTGALVGWIANPGFAVATLHRISHWGHRRGGMIGRAVSILAWRRIVKGYGCYIDPSASVGPGLRLPHPTGIVIGADVIIGANCTIYHLVTFGRRAADKADYPRLGDGVTVYAGATLLGGIVIGEAAVIGAHALVSQDVPAGGVVKLPSQSPNAQR